MLAREGLRVVTEGLERLRRLLGGSELDGLRKRLRARFERGEPTENFTLTDLDASERRALEGLLGRAPRVASSMQLRVAELDAALSRAGLASDLRTALELLDGPVLDRRSEQAAYEQAWNLLRRTPSDVRLRALLMEPYGLGLLKRLAAGDPARAEQMLMHVQLVLARVPAQGVPLAHLAAEILGDAHALDAGRPIATLLLRACRLGTGQDDELDGDSGDQRSSCDAAGLEGVGLGLSTREQWARLGVTVNELASPVLFINLRCRPGSEYGELIEGAAHRGLPVHLTLRALLRDPPAWDAAGLDVFVCENPAIVALAADRLGAQCAPLLCTDGMPGAAQQTLMRQLVAAGAQLRYHGDFDWPGLRIGNFVMRELRTRPWRFGAADYLECRAQSGQRLEPGEEVQALWDEGLAGAMRGCGFAVHEERIANVLLADLGQGERR